MNSQIFQDTPSLRQNLTGSSPAPKIVLKGVQARFMKDQTRFPGMFGSIASGKTTLGCLKGIMYSLLYPRNYGIVLRNTHTELRTSTQKKFLELIDLYYKKYEKSRNMQDNTITFTNGSEVQFLHSQSEDLFQGPEIGWFLVDQAEAVPERIAEKLTERLRKPGVPQQGMYVGNTNRGKNWCWRWFVRKERASSSYHPVTILDNVENLDPLYVKDLLQRPESWKKVWLFGSWDAPGGQIVTFTNEHMFDYFGPPREWRAVISIDPADGMGFCGALAGAVSFEDDYLIFKEYLEKERHVFDHARAIKAMWPGRERFDYMDPSAWRHVSIPSESGKDQWITLADRYRAQGIHPAPAENAILPSIDMIQERLALDMERMHPFAQKMGAPRLYVSRSCTKLLDQLTEWTWETIDAEEIHLIDALRYFVASRPPPPSRWADPGRRRYDDYARRGDKESLAWMAQ